MTVHALTVPLGYGSAMGLSVAIAWEQVPGVPLAVVPTISLVAIIGGAISMGILFQMVRRQAQDILELKAEQREMWKAWRDLAKQP